MSSSPEAPIPTLKVRSLHVRNYKRLDALDIDFPPPQMPDDLDVTVLGSQNGGGKTSVLECIGLLFVGAVLGAGAYGRMVGVDREGFVDLTDLLIRAGEEEAELRGTFEVPETPGVTEVAVRLRRNGDRFEVNVVGNKEIFRNLGESYRRLRPEEMFASLLAFSGEPLLVPPLLHFNSYRKIQEGNPDLAAMSDHSPDARNVRRLGRYVAGRLSTLSTFKMEMLRSIIGRAGLFEGADLHSSEVTLNFLNELLLRYASGTIDKLRPLPDNTLDFRIRPQKGAASFAFDGLSSGQKEIVSTLFLIWRHSRQQDREVPTIVLLDEPELHLNAEWHADLLEMLRKAGPRNQYILATHSEQIFQAVPAARRRLLLSDP